jgi:hypothetical protein
MRGKNRISGVTGIPECRSGGVVVWEEGETGSGGGVGKFVWGWSMGCVAEADACRLMTLLRTIGRQRGQKRSLAVLAG